ncbi:MAG: T9SS type A sorting domain-containing protein [Elusimicrobiales bacterium]|nr:T9SS type A sorting domain-containing protein [Elusimicrobiales bacterium]
MNRQNAKAVRRLFSLLPALLLAAAPAFCDVLPSGGDYQLQGSVIDSGGGGKLAGGEYSVKSSIGQNSMPPNLGLTSGGVYSNRIGFDNPPHFTYQGKLPVVLTAAAGFRLNLPSNSVSKELFDITLNKDPVAQPISVDPGKITNANEKIVYNDGGWSQLYANNISEMAIFDEQSFYTEALGSRGTLTFQYKDDNDDGILDGSNPPVRIGSLEAWILDQSVDAWVKMPAIVSDPATKLLTVPFGLPGVYALLGTQDLSVKNVKAYPVPFRPNGPQAGIGQGQTGTESGGITFDNLPQAGTITIFTLDGRQVKKITIPDNMFIQKLTWDVKTSSGEKVASGVYIWRIVAGPNSKTGKLMVIW